MRISRIFRLGVALWLASGCALGESPAPPPWLLEQGGGGWRQDATGAWVGTGGNAGQRWRQDVTGAWLSGRTNRASGWRQDATGAWRGSGATSGQRWRQDVTGAWRSK